MKHLLELDARATRDVGIIANFASSKENAAHIAYAIALARVKERRGSAESAPGPNGMNHAQRAGGGQP